MKNHLVVIGLHWPEPESTAAGLRMLQLLELFQSLDYEITFLSAAPTTAHSYDLNNMGIQTQSISLNDAGFDTIITELQPQIVLYDRFIAEEQFGWRVHACVPEALTILDTEDLHCLRKARQQFDVSDPTFTAQLKDSDTAKRELASIYRCDVSLIISEFEMELLQTVFQVPEALLCYLPFLVDFVDTKTIAFNAIPSFASRQHFMTVGNFKHAPNYDAVLYLKETLWPGIRAQNPKSELHIYGAYTPDKVKQLHNPKHGFIIKGFTPDIDTTMQHYRLCLAALRFGAGLKGKLLKAMQNGLPCVMTTLGAEGMFGDLPPNGCIAESSHDFISGAVNLYENEAAWSAAQRSGYELVNSRFNVATFRPIIKKLIKTMRSNLKGHRTQNFIGSLLHHHQHQSTKYLSKWIAAKNQHNK